MSAALFIIQLISDIHVELTLVNYWVQLQEAY